MKKITLIVMFIALSTGAYAQSPGFKLKTLNSVPPNEDKTKGAEIFLRQISSQSGSMQRLTLKPRN